MSSTDVRDELLDDATLEELARIGARAIRYGLERGRPAAADDPHSSAALRASGAAFVTLKRHGTLRGCIGSLVAHRPLAEDVAHNAFAAAFRDPRFPPVSRAEVETISLEISVLSAPAALEFDDEEDLLARLRPGIDGIIVEQGGLRATYLPSVWDMLPEPREFLASLRRKAGIAATTPTAALSIRRYVTRHSPPLALAHAFTDH